MFISNNMKNAILKNTHVNKLSKNEYHVYTLLNKYKNDNTNLLISSFLSGNASTDLYNTINKNLYNDITKFENNKVALECMFRTYFQNIKSNYSMRVKYDGGFYNISFIDSQLEIFDINNILQDHLIEFNL